MLRKVNKRNSKNSQWETQKVVNRKNNEKEKNQSNSNKQKTVKKYGKY